MKTYTEDKTLIAENVEVDMGTLTDAGNLRIPRLTRQRAIWRVYEAVIKGLSYDDRRRLEAYERGENETI